VKVKVVVKVLKLNCANMLQLEDETPGLMVRV